MENKAITAIILSIVAVIGGLVLNFQEFLMGSAANIKNFTVTFLYIGIWIFAIFLGWKSKSYKLMSYYLAFWIATFITSILTIYINTTDATVSWAIPVVILFIGQWYGTMLFVDNFVIGSIAIAVFSIGFSTAIVILLKRKKKV